MKRKLKLGKAQEAPVALDARARSLVEIAVESWRLDQAVERALTRMDPMDAQRFAGQYRWFQRKVDAALAEAGMRLVNLTGQPYSVGMAATPLNADEFDGEGLVVAQMVEPVIMLDGNVVRTGAVLLGTAPADGGSETIVY